MIPDNLDLETLDYTKPVSYYEQLFDVPKTTLKRFFKQKGVYHRFPLIGGQETARQKAVQIRLEYELNPKSCRQCTKALNYNQRRSTFCSSSCSQKHRYISNPSLGKKQGEETRRRIKEGTWQKPSPPPTPLSPREIRHCKQCDKEMQLLPCYSHRKYCSRKCANEGYEGGGGGYREGSGRGKSGWYKGFFCNSSWELAWVIYHLDKKVSFIRNTKGFPYIFEEAEHIYYPDYILATGEYIEIKGYSTSQWEAKRLQFPYKLVVLSKQEMKPIIEYVKQHYGCDYIKLYEGNPHNQKNKQCIICAKPCKNKCCSRTCSGKLVAALRGWDKTLRPSGESAISGLLQSPVEGAAPS